MPRKRFYYPAHAMHRFGIRPDQVRLGNIPPDLLPGCLVPTKPHAPGAGRITWCPGYDLYLMANDRKTFIIVYHPCDPEIASACEGIDLLCSLYGVGRQPTRNVFSDLPGFPEIPHSVGTSLHTYPDSRNATERRLSLILAAFAELSDIGGAPASLVRTVLEPLTRGYERSFVLTFPDDSLRWGIEPVAESREELLGPD